MPTNFLSVSGLNKSMGDVNILNNISFQLNQFQKIAIVGETGSGKTSLLKAIAGLLQPDHGEIFFNEHKVQGPQEKLVPGHPEIAYLSQYFELQKFLRVEQVLSYANSLPKNKAEQLYKICRIDDLLQRKTDQLSGGEKQRIALAKLLVSSPRLILLDEPYSHLDYNHRAILKSVVNDITKELKITCMVVSHEIMDTLPWADRVIVMKNGRIIQEGTSHEVYYHSINEYVAGLFGAFNIIPNKFFSALKIKSSEKKLMVRPSQFRVLRKKLNYTLEGKISSVEFLGSHYELKVKVKNFEFIIHYNEYLSLGEKVYVKYTGPTGA